MCAVTRKVFLLPHPQLTLSALSAFLFQCLFPLFVTTEGTALAYLQTLIDSRDLIVNAKLYLCGTLPLFHTHADTKVTNTFFTYFCTLGLSASRSSTSGGSLVMHPEEEEDEPDEAWFAGFGFGVGAISNYSSTLLCVYVRVRESESMFLLSEKASYVLAYLSGFWS